MQKYNLFLNPPINFVFFRVLARTHTKSLDCFVVRELSRNIRIQVGQNSLLFNREVSRSQKTQKWATLCKSFCINILQRKDARFQQCVASFAPKGRLVCVKRCARWYQTTRSIAAFHTLKHHLRPPPETQMTSSGASKTPPKCLSTPSHFAKTGKNPVENLSIKFRYFCSHAESVQGMITKPYFNARRRRFLLLCEILFGQLALSAVISCGCSDSPPIGRFFPLVHGNIPKPGSCSPSQRSHPR